jgi:hypothetical protein
MEGHGRALLRFDRRFSLLIKGTLQMTEAYSLFGSGSVELHFGKHAAVVSAHVTNLSFASSEGHALFELEPNPQRMVLNVGGKTEVNRVVFHVVNFPRFLNKSAPKLHHEGRTLGRVLIRAGDLLLEIQELPETHLLVDRLKEAGGYGITHVGRMSREDAKPFSIAEAEKRLQELYLFLSFARGAWAPPILSVGFDAADEKVYEDWGIRITTPWESRVSWFDLHHGEWLSALYPGFLSLICDGDLGKAVSNALYWYLRSNRGGDGAGIDSGIILSQAALERVSSAYLDAKGYTTAKSDNLPTGCAKREPVPEICTRR